MAVSTTDTYSGPYEANGVTVAFPFTFKAVAVDDVAVFIRPVSGSDQLIDPSAYNITLAAEGGTVTFETAPASGDVYVVSEPSFLQAVIFASGQPFLPTVVNEVNDRDVVRALYLKREVDRSPKTPIGGGADGQFPVVMPGGGWGFASGTGNDPALRTDLAQQVPGKGGSIVGLADGRNVQIAIDTLTVNSVAELKAIPAESRADGMVVFLKGYYSAGDLGGGQVEFKAASVVAADDGSVFQPNAGTGRYHRRETDEITTLEFGCKGDGVTDDHARFQAWLDYLADSGEHGWLARPPLRYRIDGRLTVTKVVDFDSDMKATIDFVDPDNIGFLFALANDPFRPLRIRLPTCTTPTTQPGGNFDQHYAMEGGAGPYDLALRMGTCVEVQSSSWPSVYIHRPFGFVNAVVLTHGKNDANAWMPLNNAVIEFNTVEFCEQPVHVQPKGGLTIGAVTVQINTSFSKRVLLANASEGSVSQITVHGPDQLFINEPGGAVLHGIGTDINNIVIRANWGSCGKGPDTSSLFAALGNFTVPYLTGDGASNGQTYDGNDPVGYGQGYFRGSSCTVEISSATEIAGIAPGAGGYPIAGDCIRIRDAGANNFVLVRNLDAMPAAAQTLATASGETGFLGGKGAAFFSRKILVSAAVPSLAAGATATFYFYHQLFSSGNSPKPIMIVPNSVPYPNPYDIRASDWSFTVNREGHVTITNITGGTVGAQSINFWLFM